MAAALAAPALLLAACAGTTSSGGYGGASSSAAAGGASPASHPSSHSAAVVTTHHGSLGTYLTDRAGRTLYLFMADTTPKSTCSGACASAWPPLTTTGTPQATGGARAGLLGTSTRSDGSHQVTYAGHPLYYFAGDGGSGHTSGQGVNGFGALWWVVGTDGSAITGQGPSMSSGY